MKKQKSSSKTMGPLKKLRFERISALFVKWLLENHWEEISPFFVQWQKEVESNYEK